MYLVFLVHGKSMVRDFVQKLGIFMKKFSKKTSKHDKVSYYLTFYLIETMLKPTETSKKFKFF